MQENQNHDHPIIPQEDGKKRLRSDAFYRAQWPKGKSGNPAGKKKGTVNLMSHLKNALEQDVELDDILSGKKYYGQAGEMIVRIVIAKCLAGNENLIKLVFNYVAGMPNQKIEVSPSTPDMRSLSTEEVKALANIVASKIGKK